MTTLEETQPNNANHRNLHDEDDEEEEEAWIPLQPSTSTGTTRRSNNRSSSSTSSSSSSNNNNSNNNNDDDDDDGNRRRSNASRRSASSSAAPEASNSNNSHNSRQQSLLQIQRRLETQISIKQNFIDHPIDLFWKRYIINLFKELWELELHFKLGLIMIMAGISLRIFLLSTWFIWYPKIVFVSTILILSLIVLDPFGIKVEMNRVMSTITTATIQATQAIEHLDMKQLRRLSLCLFLLPTILEMRTLSFLSHTIVASSGLSVIINFILSSCLFAMMIYFSKIKHQKPRECIYKGMLTLYGCAFFYSLLYFDVRKAPVLGAPFLTASGTLLLTYHDDDMEWIARVLRHALRLTLRDVLSSVSQKVSEDEMLQLAILRWIADYWATTCTEPNSNDGTSSSSSSSTPPTNDIPSPVPQPPSTEQATADTEGTTEETPSTAIVQVSTNNAIDNRRATRRERFRAHEVQWSELLPMLNVATEHMSVENQMLNDDNPSSTNARPDPNIFSSSTNSTTNNNQQQSNNNTNGDDPFAGLREMLMSLDVDERGKPAVMAYRRAVESFPPDKRTALTVSVVRKCPAMLTVAMNLLFFGGRSSVLVIMLLVPFVIMEYFRIRAWETCCKQLASVCSNNDANMEPSNGDDDGGIISTISSRMVGNADSMLILLCGDTSSIVRPPTLLLVWHNIQGSVSALEVGLTAARCAQTSIVAAEFAGNVMSLMQLGLEVHEHGWLHGAAVLAKEFVVMHAHGDVNTKYTKAAIGAVENAKVVGRNVQSLAEDHDTLDPVLRPVVWTLRTLTGHGWLWGKDEDDDDEPNSNNQCEDEQNPSNAGPTPPDPSSNTAASSADRAEEESKSGDETSTVKERGGDPAIEEPLEQAEKSEAGQPNHASNEEEDGLAEVMGMIASAYEQGLIDESEKNSFCEKLSKLSKDEIQDAPIIKGMKQSLQIVLDNSEDRNNKDWVASTKIDSSHEEVSEEKCVLRSVTPAFDANPKQDICVEEESKPVTGDTVLEATTRELPLLAADDSATSESAAAAAATETTATTVSTRGIDPKEGEVAILNARSEEGEEPTAQRDEGGALSEANQVPKLEREEGRGGGESQEHCGESQQQEAKKEEGENPWIQFGVAALGVVAGGLLLSMAGNENDSNNDNQSHRNDGTDDDNGAGGVQAANTSTVVIEELSDDAEEDWVSIPKKSKD